MQDGPGQSDIHISLILSATNRGFQKESRAGESGKRAFGRGVLRGSLLHEAGITCVISTYESNDDVITPHVKTNPRHALTGVGNHGN
jgi:hypothetical protein